MGDPQQSEFRVAVVTGGNRGIGREIAKQLAARGLIVVLTSRDGDRARAAAAELSQSGRQVDGLQLDVSDRDQVADAFHTIRERHGARIDVLVNNAGIAIDGVSDTAWRASLEVLDETIRTNLVGAWNCCEAAIPAMLANKYGRIVNIGSTMGSIGLTESGTSPAYRVSKAGLNMLTRVLAAELRGTGILVNSASPGYTKTDMSPDATRTVHQAADTPVWLATLPADGPSGGFYFDREPLPW